jgi:hypothetical protein
MRSKLKDEITVTNLDTTTRYKLHTRLESKLLQMLQEPICFSGWMAKQIIEISQSVKGKTAEK